MSKRKQNKTNKIIYGLIFAILVVIIGFFSPELAQQLAGNLNSDITQQVANNEVTYAVSAEDIASIPDYDSSPYVILNNNKPEFTEEELNSKEFESYSGLDFLGRCGVAMANIGLNLMPDADEERESISSVEPTGWINKKYDIVYVEYCDISFGESKVFLNKKMNIDDWYKKQAKVIFKDHLDQIYHRFSKRIPYPDLRIRKMSTRWGVCNVKTKTITLNLELMKRDLKYLDYVIVHELSHLIYANHYASFW